jgi:hypothetical protein
VTAAFGARALRLARDLLGEDVADVHPEYLRALVELMCLLAGSTTDNCRERVESILRMPSGERAVDAFDRLMVDVDDDLL